MISFWEVVRRSETGKLIDEDIFNRRIYELANQMVDKYDIAYDPDEVVPADDDLADRMYQAGLDLFLELGVYCRDTGRLMDFTRDEVEWAVKHAPDSVIYGQGRDVRVMKSRGVEDPEPPFINMTSVGTPVAEERFVPMVQSYAQEPLADTFSSAFSQTVHGRPIKAGTPQEVEAAIWNVMKLREAARAAGRPQIGIHNLISNAEATDATLAAMQPSFGVQPNDGLCIAAIAELKVDYERMKKTACLRQTGHHKYGLYGPLVGGYAGGVEATAVVLVAYHFLGILILEAQWHCGFPLHIHHTCNTTRQLLWLCSITAQALSRNSHLLNTVNTFAAAGPCTEMVVYEIVANAITSSVSGANLDLVAVARNREPERATGMEARVGAEAAHLSALQGLTREETNHIVKQILGEYEDQLDTAPIGKRFDECYDMERVQPTQEYLDLYDRCKEKLTEFGLDYSLL